MEWETDEPILMCGREFTKQELEDLGETVKLCKNLSVFELAQTICEHLDWKTPSGKLKWESAEQLLDKLAVRGWITLPPRQLKQRLPKKPVVWDRRTDAPDWNGQPLQELMPIVLEPVSGGDANKLWNDYVGRYHALGYTRPFGAHQRYFIVSRRSSDMYLGCLLFSAAAWALSVRDSWIGWTPAQRSQGLNWVVNNTRFLIFPWVQVKNLASKALSLAAQRIGADWQTRYGYTPVLLETFVDGTHYRGTCYRAANWLYLGETVGRGRMDRYTEYLSTPKQVYVYPLMPHFRERLRHCGRSTAE